MMHAILTILAAVYIVFPKDLVPDVIPVVGWLDDLAVGYLVWRHIYRPMRRKKSTGSGNGQAETEIPTGDDAFDPYRILGVDRSATPDEIHDAYRHLASQYHPDKVAHLGDEFQELAEDKFKDVQRAYDMLRRR
jgi:DnaJ like chaperone protein